MKISVSELKQLIKEAVEETLTAKEAAPVAKQYKFKFFSDSLDAIDQISGDKFKLKLIGDAVYAVNPKTGEKVIVGDKYDFPDIKVRSRRDPDEPYKGEFGPEFPRY